MTTNNASQRDAVQITPTQLGHQAAQAAADNAGEEWQERAFRFLCSYGKKAGRFMTEDVRMAAEASGSYVRPKDERAWGAIVLKAKKRGMLAHAGYAPMKSRNCHGNPKSVWFWVGSN